MTVAHTRIQVPRPRPGSLVDRPALAARLDRALRECRLVLVCAAAGCGKTSALAQQLARLPPGTASAWVSCDEGDGVAELMSAVVAALEPFDLPWRVDPDALARSIGEDPAPARLRQMAAELVNALAGVDIARGVIVIDDLHRVEGAEACEWLDQLVAWLDDRWTLVLLSRRRPALALPRLRARGEMAEFGLDDLRLDAGDVQALLAACGGDAALAARLHERTQGWAAGVRMALNAVGRGRASLTDAAIDRPMFDFLAAEVIGELDLPLHDFLVAASVLPELTPSRCAAVCGDPRAALRLEQLEAMGLFTTRLDGDGPEPVYRLHDLFREALSARFARETPERRAAVLAAAAATDTDPAGAVATWMDAERWDRAEAELIQHAQGLVMQGRAREVQTLLSRFPPAQRQASGALQLLEGQLGWVRWNWAAAMTATARAAECFEAAGDAVAARDARSYHCVAIQAAMDPTAPAYIERVLGDPLLAGAPRARALWAAAMWATRADQGRVGPLLDEMLDHLRGCTDLLSWYECCPVPPMVGLPGTRAPLQQWLAAAQRLLPDVPSPMRGMAHTVRGWLHLADGDLAAAEREAEAALAESRWLSRPVNVDAYGRGLQAVLLALRGQAAAARTMLEELVDGFDAGGEPLRSALYAGFYIAQGLRCAALADDGPALQAFAERLSMRPAGARSWLSADQQRGLAAYLALARGDAAAACAAWQDVLAHEPGADWYGQVVEARLRRADGLLRQGASVADAAAVLAPLSARLEACAAPGHLLLAGPACLSRLAAVAWHGALPDSLVRALQAAAQAAQAARVDAAPVQPVAAVASAAGPTVAPDVATELTAREWEVLACIASGDSNKLIARRLDLSPHTVKRHVANILDKLALGSRGQASAWYHEHHA